MCDLLSLKRIDLLHPKIKDEVSEIFINEIDQLFSGEINVRITSTLRTFSEQEVIYNQGRTKLFDQFGKRLGIVTNSKAGFSFHNYGLAFDFCLMVSGKVNYDIYKDFNSDGLSDWMQVVNIFKKYCYDWGGDFDSFKDNCHFQKTFGYSISDMLVLYHQADFIPDTQYLKL